MIDTQNSTLRIHTPHSGFTHSNTLSFECEVLSIRHKSGARAVGMTMEKKQSKNSNECQICLKMSNEMFAIYDEAALANNFSTSIFIGNDKVPVCVQSYALEKANIIFDLQAT